jgi:NADPH:quinone reductase-like Zn-dependent oxidoreductase
MVCSGHSLIQVKSFGLNRSELHTRLGLAEGVTFPRVLGIEAAGVVAECPSGEFEVDQGKQGGSQAAACQACYEEGFAAALQHSTKQSYQHGV